MGPAVFGSGADAGKLPRRFLLDGEKVLLETRPSFHLYAGGRIAGVVIACLLVLLYSALFLWISVGTLAGAASRALTIIGVLMLVSGALATAGVVIDWHSRVYALTSERVVVKSGLFAVRLVELRHQHVGSIMTMQTARARFLGAGSIRFSGIGTGEQLFSPSWVRPGVVYWWGIPDVYAARQMFENARASVPAAVLGSSSAQ